MNGSGARHKVLMRFAIVKMDDDILWYCKITVIPTIYLGPQIWRSLLHGSNFFFPGTFLRSDNRCWGLNLANMVDGETIQTLVCAKFFFSCHMRPLFSLFLRSNTPIAPFQGSQSMYGLPCTVYNREVAVSRMLGFSSNVLHSISCWFDSIMQQCIFKIGINIKQLFECSVYHIDLTVSSKVSEKKSQSDGKYQWHLIFSNKESCCIWQEQCSISSSLNFCLRRLQSYMVFTRILMLSLTLPAESKKAIPSSCVLPL